MFDRIHSLFWGVLHQDAVWFFFETEVAWSGLEEEGWVIIAAESPHAGCEVVLEHCEIMKGAFPTVGFQHFWADVDNGFAHQTKGNDASGDCEIVPALFTLCWGGRWEEQ